MKPPTFEEMHAAAARIIIAELQRRDAERGIVEPQEPPHCEWCFEGCPKCQPR